MKIQPVQYNNISPMSVHGYRDLSKIILNSERAELINMAEYFHTATDNELKEVTKSDNKAYDLLKSAIDMVITRKRCYLADGSSYCKQRALDLDKKAADRTIYLQDSSWFEWYKKMHQTIHLF